MSDTSPPAGGDNDDGGTAMGLAEFLAHAHAMEIEAAERYALLADQMEVHNNPGVGALFRKLAEVEARHAEEIKARADGAALPRIPLGAHRWSDTEGPETIDVGEAHYLMSPYHVLRIALRAEERAVAFFGAIAETSENTDVRALAAEYAEEERDHVREVRSMLAQYPEPDDGWADDHDPPATQE